MAGSAGAAQPERPLTGVYLRIKKIPAALFVKIGPVGKVAESFEVHAVPKGAAVGYDATAEDRFPPDVIVLAVRWYLRFGLSYRDVEELLAERGVEVHVYQQPAGGPTSGAAW